MKLQFKKSPRGGNRLLLDGYIFRMNGNRNDNQYWKCSSFDSKRCLSRAITCGSNLISHTAHNHDPRLYQSEKNNCPPKESKISTLIPEDATIEKSPNSNDGVNCDNMEYFRNIISEKCKALKKDNSKPFSFETNNVPINNNDDYIKKLDKMLQTEGWNLNFQWPDFSDESNDSTIG